MAFPTRTEYENFLYHIQGAFPEVAASTLHLYSTSALTAIVEGSVHLHGGLEIRIIEVLDFRGGCIRSYSYTILRGDEKIRWYDPQPHPDNPELASTFPHHRHEPPDIKLNRRPAPGISFSAPNLPALIADCLAMAAT